MSIIKNHIKGGGEADLPPFYSHKIGQSLRLDSGSSAHLTRTFTSSGSTKSWTLSFWIKLTDFDWGSIFGCGSNANNNDNIYYDGSNEGIYYRMETSNTARAQLTTLAEYRDPSAWYHIVVSYGSDNSIESDRLVIYVNGVQQELDNNNPIELDRDSIINTNTNHNIGIDYTNDPLDCYLAEYLFIDGQTLSSDAFGEFKNNVWIPKTYEGIYGTNGFHLDFADSSDIGKDISGNNNDWTANNLVSSDVVLDSPTNNFCTLNPLHRGGETGETLSQGNLQYDSGADDENFVLGSMAVSTGTWILEFTLGAGDTHGYTGFVPVDSLDQSTVKDLNPVDTGVGGFLAPSLNRYRVNAISTDPIGVVSTSNVFRVVLDADTGDVDFYEGTTLLGSGTITSGSGAYAPCILNNSGTSSRVARGTLNFGQDSSFAGLTTKGGFTDSNGNGDFKYEPPVGALALCSDNLPETVFSPSTGYAQREVVPISYFVDSSVRLNDDDVASLSKLFDVSGDRRTWTFSTWMKRGNLVRGRLFGSDDGATSQNSLYIRIEDSGAILLNGELGNTNGPNVETQNTFNEVDKYYHVVVAFDSTQVTPEDRVKIYVDGVDQLLTHTTSPSLNVEHWINHTSNTHALGGSSTGSQRFDGYLAETHFIDGETLTADDFGEVRNGEWIPKQYTDGYGTNGFYLNFADDQDIGGDLSGNGNDWTPVNLNDHDVVEDGPSDNYNTFDPIETYGTTGEGNLQTTNGSTKPRGVFGNQVMTSGKWYAEAFFDSFTTQNTANVGIVTKDFDGLDSAADIIPANSTDGVTYLATDGNKYVDNVKTGYGSTYSSGDLISIIVDVDEDTVEFKVNNVSQGIINKALSSNGYKFFHAHGGNGTSTFIWNFGQDSTFAGTVPTGSDNATDANGKGDFYYAPPEGALALTESNLPDTTVEPLGLCEDNFDITLWLADGNAQTVSGLTFAPDFSWLKKRSDVGSHTLVDIVRGEESRLFSDTTDPELSNTGFTLNSDGFTTTSAESQAEAGRTFVAWNWKMGGAGVINNDGSVQSIVSANVEAGQSVVGYENIPSMTTVGHGLSKPIEFAFAKNRDSSNSWNVYHKSIGKDNRLQLNTTAASSASGAWLNTDPTDKVLSIRLSPSATFDAILYCFHSVEGYSKFDSYEGNGSTDGPFIYLGFRARYLLVKTTSSGSWKVWDTERSPHNLVDVNLTPNESDAESVFDDIDILSNGIKIRTSNSTRNANGETYIYAAFAENPFKYSNAR